MGHCQITFRTPTEKDASSIWRLVKGSRTLDHNSFYCYFILCKHFASTCTVAESAGEIVGFVTGYRQPLSADTLFIWQIRVVTEMRGQGLGVALITDILNRPEMKGIAFIEATISPTNEASRSLFYSIARRLGAAVEENPHFLTCEMFPEEIDYHEAEHLFRIGPFTLGGVW